MKTVSKTAGYTLFLSLVLTAVPTQGTAQDTDFSCIKEQVRPIIQVTDQHQEFDIVLRNQCPGAVYWTMCIERMDPWTHKVIETHTPGGYVEAEKKARVNVHMKNVAKSSLADGRIQEFYVSHGYAINSRPTAACVARNCEAMKKDIRAKVTANDRAWDAAKVQVQDMTERECPDDGWGAANLEDCRQGVHDANQERLDEFKQVDARLQARLQAIEPGTCTVYGGGKNTIK